MGLQDALRKAAGLLVEMPPEENNPATTDDTNLSPEDAAEVDIDELLAEKGLGPKARAQREAEEKAAQGKKATVPFSTPATNPPKTVEQIVRDAAGPNLDEIKVDAPIAADGEIKPAAIYTAAKLPSTPFTAEQMLDMLASLPKELPLDTRRQTVNVTFGALGKSVGATPETVVADASRKMAALAAYGDFLKKRTEQFVSGGEAEIARLEAQIEEKRKGILNARQQLAKATQVCQSESDRLDDVLEFFSLDIPPSKYASGTTQPAAPGSTPQPGSPKPPTTGQNPIR